jgi:hypothetical protein
VGSLLPAGVGGTPELGLRFVLSNEDVDVAFSGMTLATWIDENAGIVERFRPLGVGDREHVDAAMAEKRKLADLYCTGCGYCMPCPHGVDLPRNFSLMNMHRLYGATEWAQRGYGHLRAAGESRCRASACTQCGECEPQCPQKIAIREQLREVAATLGDGQ